MGPGTLPPRCSTPWGSIPTPTTPILSAAHTPSPPADRSRRCMGEKISHRGTESRTQQVSIVLASFFTVAVIAGCSSSVQTPAVPPKAIDDLPLLDHGREVLSAPDHPDVKASVFIFVLTDC